MKDQLKKTFSDASRQVYTKTEGIIKTEETFLGEEFHNTDSTSIQHDNGQHDNPA